MKLKAVSMAGFKSFADRVRFTTTGKLTAVVGPNGCGKSNIVDAVRWVMGESRASQMRQEVSSDLIFNGSHKRKASDFCSVELHLLNNKQKDLGMWSEYAELSVKRTIERNSESNYYINGQRVRRRDVVDLFAGTGLGARSYGVVQQEQITRIVEAEPKRIRGHLEEVAGVATYKERRKETERRIESTQANLARLNDIADGLTRQMDSLARQAKQTVRIRKKKQELSLLQRFELLLRTEELVQASSDADEQHLQLSKQLEHDRNEVAKLEQQLKQVRQEIHKQNEAVNELQAKHYGYQSKLAQLKGQEREYDLRYNQENKSLQQAKDVIATCEKNCQEIENTLNQLVTRVEELVGDVAKKEEHIQKLHEEYSSMQVEESKGLQKINQATQNLTQATSKLQETTAHHDIVEQRLDDFKTSLASVQLDIKNLPKHVEVDNKEIQKTKQTTQKIIDQAIAHEEKRQQLYQDFVNAKEDTLRLQGKLGSLLAELEVMQSLADKANVRRQKNIDWLKANNLNAEIFVDSAQLVADKVEKAVDAVLSDYLDAFVIDDWKQLLKSNNQPAGLVLVGPTSSSAVNEIKTSLDLPLLRTKISVASKWQPHIDVALKNVYYASDLELAINQALKLKVGETIVTNQGYIVRPGVLITPQNKETGMDWQKKQKEIEQKIEQQHKDIGQANKKVEQLEKDHAQAVEQGKQYASNRTQASQTLASLEAESARVEQANEYRQRQLSKLNKDKQVIEEKIADYQVRLDKAVKQKNQITKQHSDLQTQLDNVKQDQEEVSKKVATANKNINTFETQLREARITINHEQQREQELHGRLANLQHELQNASERYAEVRQRIAEMSKTDLAKKIKTAKNDEHKALEALNKAKEQVAQSNSKSVKLEQQFLDKRVQLESLDAEHRKFELEVTSKTTEAKIAKEQLDEMGGPPEELEADELRKKYPSITAARDWIEKLRKQIEAAGPINYAADAEHAECEARMRDNETQVNDLEVALTSLQTAIKKIDSEMLERLRNVFDEVNQRFNILFTKLFDGGNASLEISGNDLLTDGILLKANPPGKKVSVIGSLSGGEKTLTAVAFLFALNELNPPPFCVLDEVDAALDETNTRRFLRLLDAMSSSIQFILITHNKALLESADHLVGVTQEEKGVSKLVSVKVEQALADAQAATG